MVAKRPREKNSRKLSTVNSAASAPGFFSLVSILTVFRMNWGSLRSTHPEQKEFRLLNLLLIFFYHANKNLGGHRNFFRNLSTVNSAASASCFFSLVCILTFFCRETDELGISTAYSSWAKRVQITTFVINFFIMQIRIKVDTEALTDMSVFRLVLPYSGPNKRNKNEIK